MIYDVSDLPEELVDALLNERHARKVLNAEREMQESMKACSEMAGDRRSIENLGRPRFSIPAFSYHELARKEGTYDCWNDESFKRSWETKNPQLAIKAGPTKPTSGWTTEVNSGWSLSVPRAPAGTVKFTKKYA